MFVSHHHLCLHLAIIICLSVSLSGINVNTNSTSVDSTQTSFQDMTTTPSTPPESTVTQKSGVTELKKGSEKTSKPQTKTDATETSPDDPSSTGQAAGASAGTTTEAFSSLTDSPAASNKSASPSSSSSSSPTSNTSTTRSPTSNTSTTRSPTSNTSSTTKSPTTSTTSSAGSSTANTNKIITKGSRTGATRDRENKKQLSLSAIVNTQSSSTSTSSSKSTLTSSSTSTSTMWPSSIKPNKKLNRRKKKRRRPLRQHKNKKVTKRRRNPNYEPQKKTAEATSKNTADSVRPGQTTLSPYPASPMSPEATIQIHPVEAVVKPVLFAAATAESKKKAVKKVPKKGVMLQGKKGDTGSPGPKGPKGEKGEPGGAAKSPTSSPSMQMQAASSAVLTEHFGPDKDVIVPFDLKLIDLADNYDNTTGVFICTIPGVYVVSLYLMSHPGAKVNARIFINSRPIAALWADDSKNSGFYPSSSIQTVSRLAFGDQVYVMLVDGGYGESWVHANYNAFSAFLLYEEVFFK